MENTLRYEQALLFLIQLCFRTMKQEGKESPRIIVKIDQDSSNVWKLVYDISFSNIEDANEFFGKLNRISRDIFDKYTDGKFEIFIDESNPDSFLIATLNIVEICKEQEKIIEGSDEDDLYIIAQCLKSRQEITSLYI